jgi:hypothetical protein
VPSATSSVVVALWVGLTVPSSTFWSRVNLYLPVWFALDVLYFSVTSNFAGSFRRTGQVSVSLGDSRPAT